MSGFPALYLIYYNLFSLNNVNCLYWWGFGRAGGRSNEQINDRVNLTRAYSLLLYVHTVTPGKEEMYAFKCAKCDSLLHRQWANVFHCWNVVSIFFCSSCISLSLSYSFFVSFYYVSFLVLHTNTLSILCHLMWSLSASFFIICFFFFSYFCRFFVCKTMSFSHSHWLHCRWTFAILSHRLTLDIEIGIMHSICIWECVCVCMCIRAHTFAILACETTTTMEKKCTLWNKKTTIV